MKSVYCIGIAGAGMSGLARYLYHQGYTVHGADGNINNTTTSLQSDIGATIHSVHDGCNIPDDCEFVVYSPAVPTDNPERETARTRGITEYSYPQYLGEISKHKNTIAVSGTNGKTTTTAMIATIMDESDMDPTVIVGGIMPRYGSNFRAGNSEWFAVEACEYKESFLHLHPNTVIITNITPDHLDYFDDLEHYTSVFHTFIAQLPAGGKVVMNCAIPAHAPFIEQATAQSLDIIDYSPYIALDWNLPVPGAYNIANAAAATAAAVSMGIDVVVAQSILETQFQTAHRRFQHLGKTAGGADIYDDYAHNPDSIDALIQGLRSAYSDKKIVCIFQPHLFSRTADFFDGFVRALGGVDVLHLLPIYGAREVESDFSVTSQDLQQAIENDNTDVETHLWKSTSDAIAQIQEIQYNNDYIVVCVGAGDTNQVGAGLVV